MVDRWLLILRQWLILFCLRYISTSIIYSEDRTYEKVHFQNIKSGNMETCNVSLFLMYIFCNASFWHRFYTSFSSYFINFLWILVQRTVVCLWCIDVTRIDMKYLVLHFEGLRTTKFERFETLNNEVYSSTCSYIIIHGGL